MNRRTRRGGRSKRRNSKRSMRNRLATGGLFTEALLPFGLLGLQRILSRTTKRPRIRNSRRMVNKLRRTRHRR